ncbi:hypothetical protein GCM10027034_33870 [Ramlibacter solisilvae]|uniref:GAF domain-containing protein n=1 Tax=Ramlibacter tataouinensis TaxID=94132 RepID=UPI000777BD55|nr:GAF domain-containing protein [Ramlibacter tataouinensis]
MPPLPHFLDYDPADIEVRIAELLVATHEGGDPLVHAKVKEALGILRHSLDMDVVFVSQFQQGRRTFRVVDSKPNMTKVVAGQSDPLEESWCQYVVSGRAPQLMKDARPFVEDGTLPVPGFEIGTHLSTPVVLKNGQVYGTLCCFSQDVKDGVSEMDLRRLRITASLLSDELHQAGIGGELRLEPMPGQGR